MKCGAKCFLVEIEMNGAIEVKPVTARTSVAARKVIRRTYGDEIDILSVREDKKHS